MENPMEQELQQINEIYTLMTEFLVTYSFQLVGAVLIFFIGFIISGKIGSGIQRLCESRDIDVTLSRFIGSAMRIIMVMMVTIIALGKLGISVTPFVAAIGALTFGISLAAQGLISNYGAGVNIIIGRPFVVGDTISVCDVGGVVTEVTLGYTRLINEDNVIITIPNKHVLGEILHNSSGDTLVEAEVGVAYASDMDRTVSAIREAILQTEGIGEDAIAQVGIDNFGDSSVNIGIRYRVPTTQFFALKFAVNKNIYTALQQANIEIPFPQREVKML
jgi:Small-conductance mechanosensitive channel